MARAFGPRQAVYKNEDPMSWPSIRSAFVVATAFAAFAALSPACGGDHAGALPPGSPVVVVPPAHPSPDPPPAVPLTLKANQDLTGGDAGLDASTNADADAAF